MLQTVSYFSEWHIKSHLSQYNPAVSQWIPHPSENVDRRKWFVIFALWRRAPSRRFSRERNHIMETGKWCFGFNINFKESTARLFARAILTDPSADDGGNSKIHVCKYIRIVGARKIFRCNADVSEIALYQFTTAASLILLSRDSSLYVYMSEHVSVGFGKVNYGVISNLFPGFM